MPKASRSSPTISPPKSQTAGASAEAGTTEPKSPTEEQLETTVTTTVGDGHPTLLPEVTAAEVAAAAAVAATWSSGVTVTGLWSINEVRNAWMYVPTLGWRKLYNGSDGAFTALVTLASQARQTGHTITFRQEADGMVHEIYLW